MRPRADTATCMEAGCRYGAREAGEGVEDEAKSRYGNMYAVLWIRNYFFSDPDPTLALISDPDPETDSNPDPACF
jgi:hypothetical protein